MKHQTDLAIWILIFAFLSNSAPHSKSRYSSSINTKDLKGGFKLCSTRRILSRARGLCNRSNRLQLRGGHPESCTLQIEPITDNVTRDIVRIRKPDIDKRSYRYFKLENELEAVVISDQETHSGAAALCVAVGQLDDPPEVQGLAHFLEHMLFLGTERFPEESDFDQFCASCAGYSNAWTSMDHTLFHFIVAHDKLFETLDRFSAFFSCPLFSESGTDREMHAVDSENNKNLQDDDRREHQLMRSMSAPSHAMSRFGAGCYKTLHDLPLLAGVDVRNELLKFHDRFYSARAMRLCVVGREGLDELEANVRSLFSPIRNSPPPQREWVHSSPFGPTWKRQVLIVPVKERRKICLFFPCPPVHPEYRTKPLHFLSQVIGHEGPHSLLASLKELGWATELSAGPGTLLPSESLFSISVTLTEQGVPRWQDVIASIFRYLKLLALSDFATRSRLRGEAATLQDLNFRFRSKEREDAYTEGIAYALYSYPPEDVLCATELYFDPFDSCVSDRVDDILARCLSPDNMRLHLICPEAEIPSTFLAADRDGAQVEDGEGLWRTEPWYGVRHMDRPVEPGLAARCRAPPEADGCNEYPPIRDMALPPPNRWAATWRAYLRVSFDSVSRLFRHSNIGALKRYRSRDTSRGECERINICTDGLSNYVTSSSACDTTYLWREKTVKTDSFLCELLNGLRQSQIQTSLPKTLG